LTKGDKGGFEEGFNRRVPSPKDPSDTMGVRGNLLLKLKRRGEICLSLKL